MKENAEYITPDEWAHISEDDRRRIAAAVREERRKDGAGQGKHVEPRPTFYVKYGKRALDLLIGGLGFIVSLPVNLILGVITYFDVGWPILFHQERIGRGGKAFIMTKFRNMTNAVNEDNILLQPEERVTKWGRIVRKTSLDELLNLWNVVKGDMSIIGPRPLTKKYQERFSAYHAQRHLVRPGLECPFHDRAAAREGWQGRLDNDIWYVENVSFFTDIRMFCLLVKKTLSKKERAMSATGQTGEFIGYGPDGRVMDEWSIPRRFLSVLDEEKEEVSA